MWPWPLTINVSNTCQQPDVHDDLDINNRTKAWDTVINQDFIYLWVMISLKLWIAEVLLSVWHGLDCMLYITIFGFFWSLPWFCLAEVLLICLTWLNRLYVVRCKKIQYTLQFLDVWSLPWVCFPVYVPNSRP